MFMWERNTALWERKFWMKERGRERYGGLGTIGQHSYRFHLSKVRAPPYHLTSSAKDQANNAGNLEWYTPTLEEPWTLPKWV